MMNSVDWACSSHWQPAVQGAGAVSGRQLGGHSPQFRTAAPQLCRCEQPAAADLQLWTPNLRRGGGRGCSRGEVKGQETGIVVREQWLLPALGMASVLLAARRLWVSSGMSHWVSPYAIRSFISIPLLGVVADHNRLLPVCRPLLSGANQTMQIVCEASARTAQASHSWRPAPSSRATETGPWVTQPSPKAVLCPKRIPSSGEPSRF